MNEPDAPVLPRGRMQPLSQGSQMSLWSVDAPDPLANMLHVSYFGRHHAGVVRVGDQIMFVAGPPDARDFGTLAVTRVETRPGEHGRVHSIVLTPAAGPPVPAVAAEPPLLSARPTARAKAA